MSHEKATVTFTVYQAGEQAPLLHATLIGAAFAAAGSSATTSARTLAPTKVFTGKRYVENVQRAARDPDWSRTTRRARGPPRGGDAPFRHHSIERRPRSSS